LSARASGGELTDVNRQVPHCIGFDTDRPLFNRRGRSDPSFIPCVREDTNGANDDPTKPRYTLCAGAADGVKPGEQFAIYQRMAFEGQKCPSPLIRSARASNVQAATSTLELPPLAPGTRSVAGKRDSRLLRVLYARRLDWRNDPVRICCSDADLFRSVFLSNILKTNQNQFVVLRKERDPKMASIVLAVDEDSQDSVYIDWNDPLINKYACKRFPYTFKRNEVDDIRAVIIAWRHWNYHLNRPGQDDFADVRMELTYLEPIRDDELPLVDPGNAVGKGKEVTRGVAGAAGDASISNYRPIGDNLIAHEPAFIGIPDIPSETLSNMGMTLYNDSDIDLYPYLFYFDPKDLTISASGCFHLLVFADYWIIFSALDSPCAGRRPWVS